MPRRPRVFISSTMEDLANERRAVADQAVLFNFEPVLAEELYPDGSSSWGLLEEEIRTCDILILLLGERYGWVPDAGYGAGLGKSVTHLEVDLARESGLTIIPFFKRLGRGGSIDAEEVRQRDDFRREMGDWATGKFRGEFDLAVDLAKSAGFALLQLLTDSFWKEQVRARDAARPTSPLRFAKPAPTRQSDRCLLAGAGLSVAAGYPTAAVLTELLGQRMGLEFSGVELLGRYSFADVAAVAEEKLGRKGLLAAISELLDTPLNVIPTDAHFQSVRAFKNIITTNFDPLFERACLAQGISFVVHRPGEALPQNAQADVTIYKLDGSAAHPESLVLTGADAARAGEDHSFWSAVKEVVESEPLVVMGHSLRDATSRNVVEMRNRTLSGVYVSPYLSDLDAVLLHRFGLQGVRAMPTDFLASR